MDAGFLIDELGGTNCVARIVGISPPSVSDWRKYGIPDDKLFRLAPLIEQKGIAKRWELFPNDWQIYWPELVGQPGAPAVTEQ